MCISKPNTGQLNLLFHTFAEFRLIVNRIVAQQSTDWLAANSQFSSNAQGTYPHGRIRMGKGYPKIPTPSQIRMGKGICQGTYPLARSGQEILTPLTKVSTPSSHGLATRQAICLLRSRRRTFLLIFILKNKENPRRSIKKRKGFLLGEN